MSWQQSNIEPHMIWMSKKYLLINFQVGSDWTGISDADYWDMRTGNDIKKCNALINCTYAFLLKRLHKDRPDASNLNGWL